MRDYQQINTTILDIEKSFPVESLVYRDIPLWPVIRQQLAHILFWESSIAPVSGMDILRSIPSFPARVCHAVTDYAATSMLRGKFESTSKVLFLTAGFEYIPFEGAYYNKFLDPVKELLDRRGVTYSDVEFGFAGKEYSPKHFRTIDLRKPVGLLSKMARFGPPDFSCSEKNNLANFVEHCAAHHRLSIDAPDIMLHAARISSLSKLFVKVLSALQPQVCMYVCYYQDATMALAHACYSRGIRAMEIQHSVICEDDWNWCKWTAIPAKGYSTLPDMFWTWGEIYSEMLECWQRHPGTNLQPCVGGNLWIWKWRQAADLDVPESTSRLRATGRTVLYTVPYGDIHLISEWFPPEFTDAVRNSPGSWKWHVRLHYKSDKELLQKVEQHFRQLGLNLFVHHADEHLLYHLFSLIDVHISQTCSTVVEAEAFGLPNLILGEVGRAWYHREIESGSYGYAKNADELLAFVRDAKKSPLGNRKRIITDTLSAETLLDELSLYGGTREVSA